MPFLRPELPPIADIESYFEAARKAGWYSNRGPCHELLAERASRLLGGRAVVPVSSAGLGLIVALSALTGPPHPGRRAVLLPSFTFAACAASVVWAGFEPVFCDVDESGWHLCPDELERALAAHEGGVAAVLACSTFGTPPPAEQARAWRRLADSAGVPLIVDSAAGLDACVDDAGADAEVFSLHATKPLPVGEGGLVALRDPRVAERVRLLVNHGLDERGDAVVVGLNAKLDEWHSATALAGLDRLQATLAARQALAGRIRAALAGADATFQCCAARSGTQFVPVALASAAARTAVLAAAGREGVELRTYFSPPLHRMPAYAHCERADSLRVTESLAERIVSLPMANDLTADDLHRIVNCVSAAAMPDAEAA
ncbi:MAG: hypothetical protein QOH76_20 [Thermoleophilaceae bacterium]|nr:hypothetical protein [Thermoleophilaceae bacterium]